MEEKQIEVYKIREGEIVFDVDIDKNTIWATQEEISRLFDVDRTVISRHIRNIFRDGELEEEGVSKKSVQTASDGKNYVMKLYNLDMIISVGYRVNSRKATDFRIWATKILKSYLVEGVAVNKRRIEELDRKKLRELEGTIGVVRRLMMRNVLDAGEANGVLEVIEKYARSFRTLEEYDSGHIEFCSKNRSKKVLEIEMAKKLIEDLKKSVHGGELFGRPRGGNFEASLGAIYQSFDGEDVYRAVEEKAANLLYLIIKDHPFYDGNKRIAALLFIVFLTINDFHLTENGETKISDRALTAIALMIAESEASEKRLIVGIVCKMLQN